MVSRYMQHIAIVAAKKMPSSFVYEKCMEECVELLDAIMHRDRTTDRDLPQEVADLEVALLIVKHHVGYEEVEDGVAKAWDKVKERLKNA